MDDTSKDKASQNEAPAMDETAQADPLAPSGAPSPEPDSTHSRTMSDKAVSTQGMPDLQDYQRAVTYELVFNSLLEKKMQAMKRECEERKRNKRLKRKSIGRLFLAKRLFSSMDSRKGSGISDSGPTSAEESMHTRTAPSTPQKLSKLLPKSQEQDIQLDVRSPSPQLSLTLKSRSKSNTASYESPKQSSSAAQADDSITSTLSNSSGKVGRRSVLVLAQTHMPAAEAVVSSSSSDSRQAAGGGSQRTAAKVPTPVRDLTCDTASLASGYDNGTGARLNANNTLGDDSLASLRDSIESLSFASSRCTVSFGATEIIPEDVSNAVYERLKAAKRQRILEAKSISAQCSPILPLRHVIKTMVHAPMSPPIPLPPLPVGQPQVNIIEPTAVPSQLEGVSKPRHLTQQFSYTDSLLESRHISRQNTSEDSANLTVSTMLNQSDSLSLHASSSPPRGFVDYATSTRPVSFNDRFKSKSTGLLVALGNGRTRPPPPLPPPPFETAQPSPTTSRSPLAEIRSQVLPLEQLQKLHIASNIRQQHLVDSYKLDAATKTPMDYTTASAATALALAHAPARDSSTTLEDSSQSTLVGGTSTPSQRKHLMQEALGIGIGAGIQVTATLNGNIVSSSMATAGVDAAALHRMTSTSTASSIGPTGCCATTTKTSTRLKEKQRFKPTLPTGQSGSDDEYRRKKRKYKRYHRCSDPVLVYPTTTGLQHCILSMPPNDPIQYPYSEDYAYDIQLQMESDKNDDLEKIVPSDSTKRKHHKHRHHRHKKRHRHKKPKILVQDLETQEVKVIDPDDLPQRARWTIIATACLLLLMCLMLVGITLRMAPIIDDMVRQENERVMKETMDRARFGKNYTETASSLLAATTSSLVAAAAAAVAGPEQPLPLLAQPPPLPPPQQHPLPQLQQIP